MSREPDYIDRLCQACWKRNGHCSDECSSPAADEVCHTCDDTGEIAHPDPCEQPRPFPECTPGPDGEDLAIDAAERHLDHLDTIY